MLKDLRWANDIKRLRYVLGSSQKELVDELDVDPSLISRWERGATRPDTDSQKKIKRMFNAAQPSLRPPFIERAPGYIALLNKDGLDHVICCSPAWAKHFDRTCREMRGLQLPTIIEHGNRWIYAQIENEPLWLEGGVAFVEFVIIDSYKGLWMRGLLAPVHHSNIAIIMGEKLDQDAPHEEQLRLVPFSEVMDDD